MNKILNTRTIAILALGVFTFNSLGLNALAARPADMENTLQVQGRGVVKTSPDCFEVSVTIRTEAKKMDDARLKNAELSKKLTSSIKALGIKDLKIETGWFNANPQYDYSKDGKSTVRGYEVSNTLNIITEGITEKEELQKNASKVLTTALNNGATSTNNVRFYLSNNNPVYDDALKSAISQARKRADLLANETGVKISGVYQIDTYAQSSPEVYGGAQNMMVMRSAIPDAKEAEPSNVTASDVSVEASVTIRYDISD